MIQLLAWFSEGHSHDSDLMITDALPAIITALVIGLACALLSVIVVLKRLGFICQGISHVAFGGVGTASLLGFTALSPQGYGWGHDLIVLGFCIGSAFAIARITRLKVMEFDTAIAIMLASAMAWGVIAQNLRQYLLKFEFYRNFAPERDEHAWEELLFGSLHEANATGMWIAIAIAILIFALLAALYKEIIFYAFDENVSRVFGVPSSFIHYLLLALLALVIVFSIRLVGIILSSALLVAPGATALLLSNRMKTVIWLSILISLTATTGGLAISLATRTFSPGASIVMLLFIFFMAAYARARSAMRGLAA